MNHFSYLIKHIRNMFLHNRGLVFLILISQIVSVILIFTSFGFFNNALIKKRKADSTELLFCVDFYPEDPDSVDTRWENVKGKFDELIAFLDDNFNSIFLACYGKDENGDYIGFDSIYGISSPSRKNDQRFIRGEYVCYVADSVETDLDIGDYIQIDGKKYEIADKVTNMLTIEIPSSTISDDSHISYFYMDIKNPISSREAKEINEKINELFNIPNEVLLPQTRDLMEEQTNNMYIAVSFLVMLIVVLNISLYYKYIFDLRLGEISIMKLCGATSLNISMIYLLEMLVEYIFSLLVGIAVFSLALPKFQDMYEGFSAFNDKSYYAIFSVLYIAVSLIISVFVSRPYGKKSLIESLSMGKEVR